ncbi:MAG: type II secretion system F family protein [bacterium]
MPKYFYKARDMSGKAIESYIEAPSREEALRILDNEGVIPIEVKETGRFSLKAIRDRLFAVSKTDIILFSTQLATMLKAGLPITRSLRAIKTQIKNKDFKNAVDDIVQNIEKGRTFYNSLSQYPQFFDEIYVATVQIGEVSGNLAEILLRLADNIEKDESVKQKIKNATLYPKLVVGAIFVAVIILITFVIPKFAALYKGFKTELPLPTRILIGISGFFQTYWYIVAMIMIAFIAFFAYLKHTESGRKIYDPLILKVPIIGELALKIVMIRFSRFFSLLFSSGVVVTNILDLIEKALGNVVFQEKVKEIKKDILAGVSLSEAVKRTGFFTPLVQEMINVGEETGALDEMLKKVSDFYENELDYTIKNLTTLIEPIMLVGIFGMVLFLALSVFLPMWDMMKFTKS